MNKFDITPTQHNLGELEIVEFTKDQLRSFRMLNDTKIEQFQIMIDELFQNIYLSDEVKLIQSRMNNIKLQMEINGEAIKEQISKS